MHFRQFYIGCLSHASYLLGDGGEAVVVDPSRDIQMYLDEAEAQGLRITWILETHLHADFVSGHRELAARTGASIGIGAQAEAGYPHKALVQGDELSIGGARIEVVETPGHTPESLSFLVYERSEDTQPWGVLTGDTLFVGDVGRVDILSSRLPVVELAGLMYDSLFHKLLALPDDTRVYPAHGAGSLCGRNMGKETWSTIGRERAMNVALKPQSRSEFIADVTRDVPETPRYYLHSRDLNKAGPRLDAEREMPSPVSPSEAARLAGEGAVIIDTRAADAHAAAHPAGAINIGLDGQYASWVGTVLRPEQPLLLLTEPARVEEAVVRLARVGYENVVGLLAGSPAELVRRGAVGGGHTAALAGTLDRWSAPGAGRAPGPGVGRFPPRRRHPYTVSRAAGAGGRAGPGRGVGGGLRRRIPEQHRGQRAAGRGVPLGVERHRRDGRLAQGGAGGGGGGGIARPLAVGCWPLISSSCCQRGGDHAAGVRPP